MKAKEQTLAELLAGTVVHVTPSFQRAYGGPDGVVAPLVEAAAPTSGATTSSGPPYARWKDGVTWTTAPASSSASVCSFAFMVRLRW